MSEFVFTPANNKRARAVIARYPEGRQQSAMLPLLDLAQRQNDGWLSKEAIAYVAEFLNVPMIKAYEVASFYTMFNLKRVGKHLVQLCATTPCWLRGSDDIEQAILNHLGITMNSTTTDGLFTVVRVECLGACVNAPMMQINDDYFEDLTAEHAIAILDTLKAGKKPKTGSQSGRQFSAPAA